MLQWSIRITTHTRPIRYKFIFCKDAITAELYAARYSDVKLCFRRKIWMDGNHTSRIIEMKKKETACA